MRVVLLQDIRGVGKRNEVKDVPDGYGRNFLIAKKLAAPATSEMLARVAALNEHETMLLKKIRAEATRLKNDPVRFTAKADEHGTLFGGIAGNDIFIALRKKGYDVAAVKLSHPIKTIGEQKIPVQFHRGISGEVSVIIVRA